MKPMGKAAWRHLNIFNLYQSSDALIPNPPCYYTLRCLYERGINTYRHIQTDRFKTIDGHEL